MRKNGFTLIELLIALVIIAILASIAIPSYESYLRKGRRVDAKNALSALQLAQEKYRGNNTAYSNSLTALGLTAGSAEIQSWEGVTTALTSCRMLSTGVRP